MTTRQCVSQGWEVKISGLTRKREEKISENTDNDHEERRERERDAEEDVEQDGPDLGPRASGKEVCDDFLKVLEHQTAEPDGLDDLVKTVEEDQVRGLDGHVRARHDGDAHICGAHGRGVIHAITRDGHDIVASAELVDNPEFLLGGGPGKHDLLILAHDVPIVVDEAGNLVTFEEEATVLGRDCLAIRLGGRKGVGGGTDLVKVVGLAGAREDPNLGRDGGGGQAVVACHHEEAGSGTAALRHGGCRLQTRGVDDAHDTDNDEVRDGVDGYLVAEGVGSVSARGFHGLLAQHNDTLRVARPLVLKGFEGNSGGRVERLDRVCLVGPVPGTSGEEDVRGALDEDLELVDVSRISRANVAIHG